MFPDPNPDSTDPHVFGPSFIIKQKSKKNLDSYGFVTSHGLFIFEIYDVNAPSIRFLLAS